MLLLLTIQAICAVFAYFNARHDVPAINRFRTSGSTQKEQKDFHISGLIMRGIVLKLAAIFLFACDYKFFVVIGAGIACGLIMWLVFDISVNLLRQGGFPWYYIGEESAIDRWLHSLGNYNGNVKIIATLSKFFSKHAGKIKAIAVAVVAIVLNILIL